VYIKCKLNDKLSIFHGLHFPFVSRTKSSYRYESIIGIGGNVGDVKRCFEHLFFYFKRDVFVDIQKTSLILKNPPFGYTKQADFFNSIMVLKTSLQPKEFLKHLMMVEKRFGRKRSFANAPRSLDLDIIFFDNRVINTKTLTVPHKSWSKRQSVVIPLAGLR